MLLLWSISLFNCLLAPLLVFQVVVLTLVGAAAKLTTEPSLVAVDQLVSFQPGFVKEPFPTDPALKRLLVVGGVNRNDVGLEGG